MAILRTTSDDFDKISDDIANITSENLGLIRAQILFSDDMDDMDDIVRVIIWTKLMVTLVEPSRGVTEINSLYGFVKGREMIPIYHFKQSGGDRQK